MPAKTEPNLSRTGNIPTTAFFTSSKFVINAINPKTKAPMPVDAKAILKTFIAPVEAPTTVV